MIARHEVLLSLYGAWRLFLRDPRGIEWLDDSIEGFWKSFFCAVVILPGYVLWLLWREGGPEGPGFIRLFTVEGIAYVIKWVAWPLLMAYIAPAIDRDQNYLRYIVAYNWSSGVQMALLLLVLAIEVSGIAAGGVLGIVMLIATIVMFVYHWYVVRIGLEVSGFGAGVLVAGDFILAQIIHGIGQTMLR